MNFTSLSEAAEHDMRIAAETKRLPGAALDRDGGDLEERPSEWVDDAIARAARRAIGIDA